MKTIKREIEGELRRCADFFPAVTILGPWQSGKTTLARSLFSSYQYVNLEDPEIFDFAQSDINAFFESLKTPVIIDEVQRLPKILRKIQAIVDENSAKGKAINGSFILAGSFQQGLEDAISESLAGRTAVINLLPLSISELEAAGFDFSKDEFLFQGFMPRHYSENQPVDLLYRSYFQTYVERDVQSILNVKNKALFEKFLRLLAGRIGQIVNYESLANDSGVSATTVSEWISVLESSFIVFKVEPYFENYTKRLVKSPKIYFYDTGLACYLLGIKNAEQVSRDPLVGNLFENMVALEILKSEFNKGREKSLYFFRDSKGFEIDLILAGGRRITPLEVKSAATYNNDFAKNLKKMMAFAPNAENPAVIYSGSIEAESGGIRYINFKNCGKLVRF